MSTISTQSRSRATALALCGALFLGLAHCATAETSELRGRMAELRKRLAPIGREMQSVRAQIAKTRDRTEQRNLWGKYRPLQSRAIQLRTEMREPYLAYARRASPVKVYGSQNCCDAFLKSLKEDGIEFTFVDVRAPAQAMWQAVRRKRGKDQSSVGYPVVVTADDQLHTGGSYENLTKLMGPRSQPLTVYGNNRCGNCLYFKRRFEKDGVRYRYHNVDELVEELMALQLKVYPDRKNWYTMPVVRLQDGRVHVGNDYEEFGELLVGVR